MTGNKIMIGSCGVIILIILAAKILAGPAAAQQSPPGPELVSLEAEIMGKETDGIYVAERKLAVNPRTRIIDSGGRQINLDALATPCLAVLEYADPRQVGYILLKKIRVIGTFPNSSTAYSEENQ